VFMRILADENSRRLDRQGLDVFSFEEKTYVEGLFPFSVRFSQMGGVPTVMATQHPDSAKKYVPVQEEVDEALEAFLNGYRERLHCDEYKVDYEGKLTPYHQVSQIVLKAVESKLKPGRDIFVTPRMPSAREETAFRQIMSVMAAIEANYLTQNTLDSPAVIEIIHPMTKDVGELLGAKSRMNQAISLAKNELGAKLKPEDMSIIPLFESVSALLNIDRTVKAYVNKAGKPERLRVFIGRSDPAMMCGLVAAVLAAKIALSKLGLSSEDLNVPIYPILGVGSLPFRGHLTPENIENFLKEYSGIKTVTVQSALRYDYPKEKVKRLIRHLRAEIPKTQPTIFDEKDVESMVKMIQLATRSYRKHLAKLMDIIVRISKFIPNQRDRLSIDSDVKYGRTLNEHKPYLLPRVIKTTAAFYTIGLPPEFLGVGAFLEKLTSKQLQFLREHYLGLTSDLKKAGKFLNFKVASKFIGSHVSRLLEKDVEKTKRILKLEIEPDENYTTFLLLLEPYLAALLKGPNSSVAEGSRKLIIHLGLLRKSLG